MIEFILVPLGFISLLTPLAVFGYYTMARLDKYLSRGNKTV